MMNVVALCFVLTLLLAAGIRSPPPPVQIQQDDVIVKEGHRLVEIEYENGGTKVKISPQELQLDCTIEKVCDAFGKCRQKVLDTVGQSKDMVSEKAHEVKDKVMDQTKGKAHDAAEKAGEATEKVKQTAKEAAHSTKEKLKEVSKEVIDTGNTLQQDVRRNSTEYLRPLLPDSLIWASASMKLLGISLAFGTCAWVSLISSYLTADTLPRQLFAVLQCKLYAAYFKVMASSIGIALLSHFLSADQELSFIQALNLSVSLSLVLFNLIFMEPRANKLMFEMMRLEKEEGKGTERATDEPSVVRNIDSLVAPLTGKSRSAKASANPSENPERRADSSSSSRSEMVKMSEKLKKLNFYSSALNVIVLASLAIHLVHLSKMLHA